MSHLFFEPEMGLSAHFQQKRPKMPKKIFREREEKSVSCPGTGNGIFLPLSDFFLFFFPLYEITVEAVLRLFEAVLRL